MKKQLIGLGTLCLYLILLSSCASNTKENRVKKSTFSYDPDSTFLQWTAYKTSEKLPVNGTFTAIEIKGDSKETALETIEALEVVITTNSVQTNDTVRNSRIERYFFQEIQTDEIRARFKNISKDGAAVALITMNNRTVEVPGTYVLQNNTFTFNSDIDLGAWNALRGIMRLNEVCKDLHAGKDGVSKLWQEVTILFTCRLKST